MHKDKRCLICKYQFKINNESNLTSEYMHFGDKNQVEIKLCKIHSIELFKMGQYRFIKKYEQIGHSFVEVDNDYRVLHFIRQKLKEYEEHNQKLAFYRYQSF